MPGLLHSRRLHAPVLPGLSGDVKNTPHHSFVPAKTITSSSQIILITIATSTIILSPYHRCITLPFFYLLSPFIPSIAHYFIQSTAEKMANRPNTLIYEGNEAKLMPLFTGKKFALSLNKNYIKTISLIGLPLSFFLFACCPWTVHISECGPYTSSYMRCSRYEQHTQRV